MSAEALVGSSFADTLTGDAGSNLLLGLGGDDVLFGGQSADDLVGGGNNTFAFRAADFQAGVYDQVIDFHEALGDQDALTIIGVPFADVEVFDTGGGVLITTAALAGAGGVFIQNFTSAQLADQLFVI